jgi:hypothetical protein
LPGDPQASTTGYWPSVVALVVSAFAAMGYTVSRTVVKNG